jgi:hypothetical protein
MLGFSCGNLQVDGGGGGSGMEVVAPREEGESFVFHQVVCVWGLE